MLYILYGLQYPVIKKRINKILKENLVQIDEFNLIKLDNDICSIDDVILEGSMLPLGYEKKAVVVDNVSFLKKGAKKEDIDKILDFLKTCDNSIDLFFIVRSDSIDDNSPICKYVLENGQIMKFVELTKEEWPRYVKKYFKDKDVSISDEAIKELISRIDGDLTRFINEADKLINYKNNLSLSDVCLMVSKPLEDDAFQMSNALLRGDNATALSIFRDLRLLGNKNVDYLIPMLAKQFRFIFQVSYLYSEGLDKDEIAHELSANAYRVKMTLNNIRRFPLKNIVSIIDELYYLDYQIKSGQIDRFYGIELFLINF